MPRKLEIHTLEFFPKQGGIGRYCRELARGAASAGWTVTLHGPKTACRPEGDDETHYSMQGGAHGYSHGPLNLLRSRNALATAFRTQPGSLHLLAEPGSILASGLLPNSIFPPHLQLVLHGSEIERWSSSKLSGLVAKRAIRRASGMIVPSAAVSQRLKSTFPESTGRVRVIHHALPSAFRPAAASHKFPQSPKTGETVRILSVGRIHRRKGFDQVLTAITKLSPSDRARLHYSIIGSRSDLGYEKKLKQVAETLECPVEFILDPDDTTLAAHYASADAFILTSLPHRKSVEGFGLVYLEAGAFGLPSLAYRTGGVEAAIQDGVNGRLFPLGDTYAIAEGLRFLIRNPEARLAMGLRAREMALARDWRDVAEESLIQ